MKRIGFLLGGAALALSSSLALAEGPEDLLPPSFRNPQATPTPTQAPTPTPTASRTATPNTPSPGGTPVVQPIPGGSGGGGGSSSTPSRTSLPANFPSLRELEQMEESEVNDLFGLRPKFDIRAALAASEGPVVSRWGHILMRRALASRLDAPQGLDPVQFAAMRARALNAMGESAVARALVQDVDGSNYNRALTDAAMDSYLATGDVLGMCPVARLQRDVRDDGEWEMLQAICSAYLGESRSAERSLDRALGTGRAPEIDVRLAQRYAGAGGDGGRAVNIEWDGTDELTPWRFALARALGVEIPESLREGAGAGVRYDIVDTLTPATPLAERVSSADEAGARGVLSSGAMVDLYSQYWASDAYSQEDKATSELLRDAYVADSAAGRVAAMRQLWEADAGYGRQVLTAYAAARVPVSEAFEEDAFALIASMLAAGLDRNAMRWGNIVPAGSQAWGLLALAQPQREGSVSGGDVDSFIDDDESADQRKSAFLVAGLAGLGRLDDDDFSDFADRLGVNYARQSAWSNKIEAAAGYRNQALVAMLAGLGMQGSSWEQMTPRQLYYVVRSLNRAGLSAEARMIAAEAVARG